MSIFHRTALVFATTVCACGCRPTAVEPMPPVVVAETAVEADAIVDERPMKSSKVRPRYTSTFYGAFGNAKTLRFFEWSRTIHPAFADGELNPDGDCISLSTHPCYSVRDDELAVIAELEHLESLNIYSPTVTDAGLLHLAKSPALRHARLCRTRDITDAGLELLRKLKPDLQIDLPRLRSPSSTAEPTDGESKSLQVAQ